MAVSNEAATFLPLDRSHRISDHSGGNDFVGLWFGDWLGFRSANLDNKLNVSIDNLRGANVPEPGSLAPMGLALAGPSVS